MTRELPVRPDLNHLRKQAKALLRELRGGSPAALERFRADRSELTLPTFRLADAQLAIAREYGFPSWQMLRSHVVLVNQETDPFGALCLAVRVGDAVIAGTLLRHNPELRQRLDEPMAGAHFGETPLLAAVGRRDHAMVDVLLASGADINARSHWWAGGFGPLDTCDATTADFLIARGARVDAHSAARLGMLEELKQLVAREPGVVNARGGDGQTPLHFASTREIVEYLLDNGADIEARDVDHESTPAMYMCGERVELARLLVARGCAVDVMLAAAVGDTALVREFLDADPRAIDTIVSDEYFPRSNPQSGGVIYIWALGSNKSLYAIARERGYDDLFELLMQRSTPAQQLVELMRSNDESAIAALLAEHPDAARTLRKHELEAIVHAAQSNDTGTVRRMLGHGWDARIRTGSGTCALHWAGFHGNVLMSRALIDAGADVHARDGRYDGSPLGWTLHGSVNGWGADNADYGAVATLLLDAGADLPPEDAVARASDAARAAVERWERSRGGRITP